MDVVFYYAAIFFLGNVQYQLICNACPVASGGYQVLPKEAHPRYCGACHSDCAQCSGPSQSDCTACPTLKYFFSPGKRCYSICPLDRSELVSGVCVPLAICVDTNCKFCSKSNTYCLQCKEGYYLKQGTCTSTCSDLGFFAVEVEEAGKLSLECRPCSSNCKECAGPDVCLTCNSGFTLGVTFQCEACSLSCQNCKSGAQSICSSCDMSDGFFDPHSQTCQPCSGNPAEIMQVTATRTCSYIPGCTTRVEPSVTCLACGVTLFLDEESNSCTNCPSIGFASSTSPSPKCMRCAAGCRTCVYSAMPPGNCLSCLPGYYFTPSDNLCKSSCPAVGWYPSYNHAERRMECLACDTNCLTCSGGSPNQCLACAASNYLDGTGSCVPCSNYCQICTSGSVCRKCLGGYKLFELESTCIESPSTPYQELSYDSDKCTINNYKCESYFPTGVCQSCLTGYYLLAPDNKCTNCLMEGYVIDTATRRCKKCSGNCKTCEASDTSICLQCMAGFFKLGSTCVLCNQQNQVRSGGSCHTCHTTCLTCYGPQDSNCAACPSGKHLTSTDKCITCGDGYYIDDLYCRNCSQNCRACGGPTALQCEACLPGYFKDAVTSLCVACDTASRFFVEGDFCRSCHSSCKTCRGDLQTDCLSCDASAGLYLFESGQCGPCASPGQSAFEGRCFTCDQTCATCKGPTAKDCLSCPAGRLLYPDPLA